MADKRIHILFFTGDRLLLTCLEMKKNIFSFMVLITGVLLFHFAQHYYTLQSAINISEEAPLPSDIADSNETEQAWDDEIIVSLHNVTQGYRMTLECYYESGLEPLPLVALPMHFPPPNNG